MKRSIRSVKEFIIRRVAWIQNIVQYKHFSLTCPELHFESRNTKSHSICKTHEAVSFYQIQRCQESKIIFATVCNLLLNVAFLKSSVRPRSIFLFGTNILDANQNITQ